MSTGASEADGAGVAEEGGGCVHGHLGCRGHLCKGCQDPCSISFEVN